MLISGGLRSGARVTSALAAFAIGLGLTMAVQLRSPDSAPALAPTDVARAVQSASARGTHSAVAILDTQTGAFWGAGDYLGTTFASESLIKVFIATRLLATGQMTGPTAAVAWKMITQSDDASANALYGRVGGDSLINWVKAYYHIPFLGTPPSRPGWWGNTHVTAEGMAFFFAHAKIDAKVGPWLINAMRSHTVYGSDGFYQEFGIPQATGGAVAIKQGWGNDDDNANSTELNSTGYVGAGNRYTVAILSQHIPAVSTAFAMATIDQMARLALPGGRVDNPADHNPIGHVDVHQATGSTVRISGWTLDPDLSGFSTTAAIIEGSTRIAYLRANGVRPDVDRVLGVTGNHGFSVSLPAINGRHAYCVSFVNIYSGTANPTSCYVIGVNGSPTGYLDLVSAGPGERAMIAGWAFDPDSLPYSSTVAVTVDAAAVGTFAADLARPDVNRVMNVHGNHGFAISVPTTPGRHTYCVTAVNTGFAAAPSRSLGCRVLEVTSAAGRVGGPSPDRPAPTTASPTAPKPAAPKPPASKTTAPKSTPNPTASNPTAPKPAIPDPTARVTPRSDPGSRAAEAAAREFARAYLVRTGSTATVLSATADPSFHAVDTLRLVQVRYPTGRSLRLFMSLEQGQWRIEAVLGG